MGLIFQNYSAPKILYLSTTNPTLLSLETAQYEPAASVLTSIFYPGAKLNPKIIPDSELEELQNSQILEEASRFLTSFRAISR